MFILLLPVETNNLLLMLLGFLLGFTIDIFYDSLGLHAMALVAVGYLRNYWLGVITPQGGYDSGLPPTLASNGLQWFLVYTIPLLFLHHFILFFVEAAGFSRFGFTLIKVMMSLLFTLTVVLILQYFSLERKR
ncbi:MAG: Rod shape-determining protein MreD [Cyclobacteriaceae bacterium]|nr:Rod shape-determining protein MreD [Cyclobacteriaceae bacterium]